MKRLALPLGILLQALFAVGAICALAVTDRLRAAWFVPGDTYWNGFLADHMTLWALRFWLAFALGLELPGLWLTRKGLQMNPIWLRLLARRKPYTPPRCPVCLDKQYTLKIWKRGGDWVTEKAPCTCLGHFSEEKKPHV